jgi:hypothetical protein
MKDATIFANIDTNLLAKFKAFHQSNPRIWFEFKRHCFEIKKARNRYSHWAVIASVRWQHDLNPTNEAFKINNDYISLYARLMIHNYNEFDGFFELRAMKESDRKISMEEINRMEGAK